jgi:HlyD family secretion protein
MDQELLRPLPTASSSPLPSLEGLFSQSDGGALIAPPRRRRRSLGWVIVLAVIFSLGAYVAWRYWPAGAGEAGDLAGVVARGDLTILVTERGELESAQSVSVRCEVEGRQIKIVEITEEGAFVKQGQVVVKFDSEELTKNFQDQEIKLKQAEGKSRAAEEDLKVQINKAEGENDKARLALTIAELERDKYLAEQGEYQVQVEDARGAIALATKELEEAMEQLKNYRTLVRKGFGTPESLRQREAAVERAQFNLLRDKAKLFVLEKYTFRRQKAELEAKARDAQRDLERTEATGRAAIEKARSDLEAAQITARLEKRALERLQKQLDNCTIKAPQDGILVYDKDRYWDPSSVIRPGGMVYYQQTIFKLPDLSRMKVRVKVHESQVKKVTKGLPAEIIVDALPNQPLQGTVQSVATLADSRGYWDERAVKEYVTEVSIDQLPSQAGLKPGMTAEVRIHAGTHRDVLYVPVTAVSEREGKNFAYVLQGKVAVKREVEVGESNEKFISVKSGLAQGERIALNARHRLLAEAKAAGQTAPSAPSAPAPLPPALAAPVAGTAAP